MCTCPSKSGGECDCGRVQYSPGDDKIALFELFVVRMGKLCSGPSLPAVFVRRSNTASKPARYTLHPPTATIGYYTPSIGPLVGAYRQWYTVRLGSGERE